MCQYNKEFCYLENGLSFNRNSIEALNHKEKWLTVQLFSFFIPYFKKKINDLNRNDSIIITNPFFGTELGENGFIKAYEDFEFVPDIITQEKFIMIPSFIHSNHFMGYYFRTTYSEDFLPYEFKGYSIDTLNSLTSAEIQRLY